MKQPYFAVDLNSGIRVLDVPQGLSPDLEVDLSAVVDVWNAMLRNSAPFSNGL